MKRMFLLGVLMLVWLFTGCIWVGTTITGELGLYYKPPTTWENYQIRSSIPYTPYYERVHTLVGYRQYPDTWRYWR